MEWISVKDRLPENLQSILVTNGKVIIAGGFYEGPDKFCANSFDDNSIHCCDIDDFTHWMPLPSPPNS